jgi:hypothetical protein
MHKQKRGKPHHVFFARISVSSERVRLKLQRQLGDVSNAEIAERAFAALEAELNPIKTGTETSAAA